MQFHLIVVNTVFKKRVTKITKVDKPIALQEISKQGINVAGVFVNTFSPTWMSNLETARYIFLTDILDI